MPRISIVGAPGTGKSTLAAEVSEITGARHVELDALWWRPGWRPRDVEDFRARVRSAVEGENWVVEGYYLDEAARPIVWPRAELIVWLDLPSRIAVPRALRRSAVRVLRREALWGTNTQGIGTLAPRSVFRFARRWPTYPSTIEGALALEPSNTSKLVRLRDDRDTRSWLAALRRQPGGC